MSTVQFLLYIDLSASHLGVSKAVEMDRPSTGFIEVYESVSGVGMFS